MFIKRMMCTRDSTERSTPRYKHN